MTTQRRSIGLRMGLKYLSDEQLRELRDRICEAADTARLLSTMGALEDEETLGLISDRIVIEEEMVKR